MVDAVSCPAGSRRYVDLWVNVWGLTSLAAAAGLLWLLRGATVLDAAASIPWVLFVPAFVLSEAYLLRVRAKGRVVEFSLSPLPLATAFLLLRPTEAVVAMCLGLLVAMVIQRDRPAMYVANIGSTALSNALGLLVAHAIVFVGPSHPLVDWLAVTAALLVASVASVAQTAPLLWIRRQEATSGLFDTMTYVGLVTVVSSTVAFLSVRIVSVEVQMIWLLVGLAVLLGLGYRSYTRLLSQNESLERLYESTREVDRPRTESSSIQTLLDQTLELLGADLAEITLLPSANQSAVVLITGRDGTFREVSDVTAARMAEERVSELEGEVPDAVEYDREVAVQLSKQIITAPLHGTDGIIGTLRVSMNPGEAFTDSDRQLFEMFANHASVALRNSTLIEELQAEVAEREHQALHDSLTALPNRVMFDLRVRQALDRATSGEVVAVLLADLDRFKEVNDTLGHDHGDELLEILAERVGDLAVEGQITVARLGGDEFAVLLRGAAGNDEVLAMAQRMKTVLESPCEIAGVLVDIGASIGIALAPRDGYNATTLLQRADVAMYVAKHDRTGVAFYEQSSDPYSSQRLSLAADLRKAVAGGEIEPWFQPVMSLTTDLPTSVEALARWTHPELGPIPPDVFIPIAEQSGLIRDLTYSILDRSLEQVRRWRSTGHHLKVAVNLSVRCLTDPRLVEKVERHLDLAGVDADCLTLEVTEGTIMADPVRAIEVLQDLRDIGVRLSIDDFGTGYSSLSQLKRMPVDQLKVDRSFVMNLPHDLDDAAIVKSVITLGHDLEMQVVAEGVEELETLDALRDLECDSVQGYYVSRPLPAADLLTWLRRRPSISRVPARTA